jgi:hypothetical protein
MPDIRDEESLENPEDAQPEIPSGGMNPYKDTETINPIQESENMEVHHHPDIHHKPKKWKEYFLEFLMIFLAVTLGFIAENIREQITESTKEKQYITGFIRNVKDDTANLRQVIEFYTRQVKGVDSMLTLAHTNMLIDSSRKSFYYLALQYLYSTSAFKSNDATLQQLKSTGDYRLIEKDHTADSLAKYDAEIHSIYIQGSYYETYFKEILSRLDELTDITVITDTSFIKNGKMMNRPFPHLREDNGKLATLFNKIFDFRQITNSYAKDYLKPQLENSKRLIAFLRKEYDIKE